MRIRIATHADADAGTAVLRRSIEELCHPDHGGDASVIAAWLGNKTPAIWCEWVDRDDASVYVAVEFSHILGVGMIGHDGTIMLNYVSPDARWRGVTKALLAHMEAAARAMGLTRCTLESTKTARRFYESAGYRPDTSEAGQNDRMAKLLDAMHPQDGPTKGSGARHTGRTPMIQRDLAPAMRWKVLLVTIAFTAGGCFALWLGLSGVMPFFRALDGGEPVVSFRPSDLIPLPLAISMFAFAIMCLIPVPPDGLRDRRQRKVAARTWRGATILLGVAAFGAVMAAAASPVGQIVVSSKVADRGYMPCPEAQVYEHRPPLRWHLPGGRCP